MEDKKAEETELISKDAEANSAPRNAEETVLLSADVEAGSERKKPEIDIKRTALTLADFPELTTPEEKVTAKDWFRNKGSSCKESLKCSGECLKKKAISWFPFIGVLRQYNFRQWLLLDIVAGLTVGVMHVPQGMGFAMLANLPPIYGLYSSFFPVITYFFFTTSRHTSFGTMSLVAMMLGAVVEREVRSSPISILEYCCYDSLEL